MLNRMSEYLSDTMPKGWDQSGLKAQVRTNVVSIYHVAACGNYWWHHEVGICWRRFYEADAFATCVHPDWQLGDGAQPSFPGYVGLRPHPALQLEEFNSPEVGNMFRQSLMFIIRLGMIVFQFEKIEMATG